MNKADQEAFLQKIREGHDRATAAFMVNPEYTGSMFKKMISPTSRAYDKEFAEAYEQAVADRGVVMMNRESRVRSETRPPRTQTGNGYTKATHLTDEQLDEFIGKVEAGIQAATAAKEIEPPTSITQIHRRAARDHDFADRFRIAKEEGFGAYQEILRAEATRQALAGDYRALRDQMLMHIPEAKVLFTSRHEVGVEINAVRMMVQEHFPELPPEILDALIRAQEEKERKALSA